jgi:hypothetical protein
MVTDEGAITILMNLLANSAFNGHVRLFTDDITPDASTVIGDLTEPTFTGYAQISLASVGFPTPTINGSGEAESDGPTMTWTCTSTPGSPETIHGIYVQIDDPVANPKCLYAARFSSPSVITASGDAINKKLNWFAIDLVP